ncbi:MAG TPA: hypothetical protein VGL77_01675 [Armatimonadota bacterium]|jgi:hypothetical protein
MNMDRTRLRRLSVIILLGLFGVWLLISAIPQRTVTDPVYFVRNGKGQFVAEDARTWPPRPLYSWRLARTNEHLALDMYSMTSAPTEAPFFCERLAIVASSPHPLAQRIAEHLVLALGKAPFITAIAYYPCDGMLRDTSPAADLILRVRVADVSRRNLLCWQTATASVDVTGSSSLVSEDMNYTMNALTPWIVRMEWHGHQAYTQRGVSLESWSARYQYEAASIAAQVATSFLQACGEQQKTHDYLSALPSAFYPAYQSPPSFQFLSTYHATLLACRSTLLTPTDIAWKFTTIRSQRMVGADICRELAPQGWKLAGNPESGWRRLSLTKGTAALTIATIDSRDGGPEYTAHYTQLEDACLQQQAIDVLLAQHPPKKTVAWLVHNMTLAQRSNPIVH